MSWTQVLAANALASGERKVVKIGNRKILLLNHQDRVYAMDNSCPHMKLPMKKGKVTEDGAIICPFHRSAFDLTTGEVKNWTPFPPVVGNLMGKISTQKSLSVFPTRIEEGNILVDVEG